MKKWFLNLQPASQVVVVAATIAALATIIGSILQVIAAITPPKIQIQATQTAEAKLTAIASTPTPTATAASRNWRISFTYAFPPGTWTEGNHTYRFNADCPDSINSTPEDEPVYAFAVSTSYSLISHPVYIRRKGLFFDPISKAESVNGIHPFQETIASYTIFVDTFEKARESYKQCTVSVSFDGGVPIWLTPEDIEITP